MSKILVKLKISRSVYRYKTKRKKDKAIIDALLELAKDNLEGFSKYYHQLRREGKKWNHKRVYRVYKELGLNKRIRRKKRLPSRNPKKLEQPEARNEVWSCDFMSDRLWDGRQFRTFNVIDDHNREALKIEIDLSLTAERVVRVLECLRETRGLPKKLRMDNGPEFISKKLKEWMKENGVKQEFIEPGKPAQNGYVERFNRTYRENVLNAYLFNSLEEARQTTSRWMERYNEIRPHESLGNVPPERILAVVTSGGGK